jgi:hypothetical protein
MSVGGAQFPAGQLISSLKQLWPHIHTRSEISGSIEKLVSPKGWSVVIVARREDDNRVKRLTGGSRKRSPATQRYPHW